MHMGVVPQVVEWGRGYGGSCEGWNKVITTPECDKSNVNMKKALSSSATCYLEQVDELVCWYKQAGPWWPLFHAVLCFPQWEASWRTQRGRGGNRLLRTKNKTKKEMFIKNHKNMSKNSRHESDFYNTHLVFANRTSELPRLHLYRLLRLYFTCTSCRVQNKFNNKLVLFQSV